MVAVLTTYRDRVSELEEALTLSSAGHGRHTGWADPRYESVNGMFGGWTAALLMRAVTSTAGGETVPCALTVNYIGKVAAGTDVAVRSYRLGGGRSLQHWAADLVVDGADDVLAHAVVVLSERRATDGHTEPAMPDVPDPESLGEFHPPGPQGERIVHRPVSGYPSFNRSDTASLAWVRETTGRAVDSTQLAFLSDSYAPRPLFWSEGVRPTASITLSVYFLATEAELAAVGDDYVLNEAIGSRGVDSVSGQQARLWSRNRELLATTEQLCWYR